MILPCKESVHELGGRPAVEASLAAGDEATARVRWSRMHEQVGGLARMGQMLATGKERRDRQRQTAERPPAGRIGRLTPERNVALGAVAASSVISSEVDARLAENGLDLPPGIRIIDHDGAEAVDRYQGMATFVRVVETGSFSAAARQLNVGQPAVSKVVAQLEARLGVSLLVRSTHGLSPTEAGQRFYERAGAALREADEAELAARGAGASLSGTLRVSGPTTFARLHVVPRLPAFLDRHPELDIEIILDDRVVDLVVEGVDLSLRLGSLPDSSAVARKLATSRRSVLATPAYLARAGAPRSPAELAGHRTVAHGTRTSTWTFGRAGAQTSVAIRGRVRVSAAEGLRAAVLADMGLTVTSDWMFAGELASGAVVRVLDDWALPSIDLWAVFPAGRLASAKARQFAAFVEETLRPLSVPA